MPDAHPALPRWDLTTVYPSLHSEEFNLAFGRIAVDVHALARFWDEEGIALDTVLVTDDHAVRVLEEAIGRLGTVVDRIGTVIAYVRAHISTDSRNAVALARLSEAHQHLVVLEQLDSRLTAWIGALDLPSVLRQSEVARVHEYLLRRAQTEAAHQMSPAEEALAVELNVPGGNAWGRLHDDITSQMTVDVESAGGVQSLPMSAVRNLAFHPDRETRRNAYQAELAAWEKVAVPLSAALNAIKGEDNVLVTRRGWGSSLDVALFNNHIDRPTLHAMMSAARASFPRFREYMKAKCVALNVPALAWYDIEAPVGTVSRAWTYEDARVFIAEQFGTFSRRLQTFAERVFSERWIDAEPRDGKRGGGFCMPMVGDQSRILVNYDPSFDGVSTLAHEIGHAYHNLQLSKRPPLLRGRATPSTLAETASTFCETVVRRAGLRRLEGDELLALLDASLAGTCQVIVDITSRFLFESRVVELRKQRELSVAELNEIMVQTQKDTYGDAVDDQQLHPYMWAVKSHYYTSWGSFYNFPYMFGQLFGLGLFAVYSSDPERFVVSYDDFLSSTSMADAADLAARFGADVRSPHFWESSLNVIGEDIDRFVRLVGRR